jgi:hypothetical protein
VDDGHAKCIRFRSCVNCGDYTLDVVENIERIAVSDMFAQAMTVEVVYG